MNDPWLLYQLADSAFPAGGFAHSGGLESAWRHGRVTDAGSFEAYLGCQLAQGARMIAPFVVAAHSDPDRMDEWDDTCDSYLTNQVANRASRAQGQAFLLAASRVFAHCESGKEIAVFRAGRKPRHLAPVFGAVARKLGIERAAAVELIAFVNVRSFVSAAVRLGIVGPLEAQTIQSRIAKDAGHIVHRAAELQLDDVAQTAPLLDLMHGAHDRLYSRLFQS